MRGIKNILVLILIAIVVSMANNLLINIFVPVLIICLFAFNFFVRNSIKYKNYFTSEYNIFTNKSRIEKVYDVPTSLMFDKLKEVIVDSEFDLIAADEQRMTLLSRAQISWKTFSENLYIDLIPSGSRTLVKCCSTTLFGMYDWGKNEDNCSALLEEIETSLVV